MADDAIWRWYSMTKPITGVALLTLYEQARCKLTDPIHRYLPEWRAVRVRVKHADGRRQVVDPERPITVRDAMMHMTGVGFGPREARLDLASLVEGNGARMLDAGVTLADLSVLLAKEPLRFHPGCHWLYSWSTDLCARLVEVMYGEIGFDGFGLTVAVGLGPARSGGVGPAGDFMWGGAASTIFWVDPTEDLFVVFMTQLIPSGTFDFRSQLRALTYGAIAD